MNRPSLTRGLVAALALVGSAGTAFAQGALKPVDALVVNPPSRPVPVTLQGGVGAISGSVNSGDKNITAYDQPVTVDTPTHGNHLVGPVDVSSFKEVRLSISRASCSPCSQVEVRVNGVTSGGRSFQIDEFVANQTQDTSFPFASRTYSVPGSKLVVSLRALMGSTSQDVLVTIIGRAN